MAAGLGFKTFTTGEVLTAADTNGYLMQGVLVFASSAARAAAITSPQEGQYSYLKDTNSTEYYDGAAWIAAPIGDITGVTAGVGISGGGTSGTVTVTNSMATEITASGDIIVGTGSGTFDNLPIGTTGQILTADTTVSPYKVKWATAAGGGGMTLLSTTTISGDTTISSIDQTYVNLFVTVTGLTNLTASTYQECLINATAGNVMGAYYGTNNSSATLDYANSRIYMSGLAAANYSLYNSSANAFTLTFENYASTTANKTWSLVSGYLNSSSVRATMSGTGEFSSNTAISSLQFRGSAYALNGGTIKIYGVK